jgi:hypothetical protein
MEKEKKYYPVQKPFNLECFQKPSGQFKPIAQIVMEDIIVKSSNEFFQKLREYLKTNLHQFGHTFGDDKEFLDFCSARINRISFTENPNHYEFYLDYIDDGNRGHYIGSYCDKVEFINEGDKIIALMG